MTIFKKIIDKEIPANIVYEDEHCLAFKDIRPRAPQHVLLIPKKEIPTIADVTESDLSLLGHLMTRIPLIADKLGLKENGFRVVINCKDDGGQEVYHLHLHIMGGRKLTWPPG